jgi:amino acid adenylation domain-containing protein
LLVRVRDLCVAADSNQDLPFEKLVQELQPERNQSRNPLFQVMFVLQNATRPFTGIPGLRIEPLEIATGRSSFDLSLFLREREGKYIGHIDYSTDLFERDTIERMAGHYQRLLEGIVADPDQPIATLPILTETERHKILVEWNDTAADYPKDRCIHELFEEQVERIPEAIAVEFEDRQITYQELNRRANQLAHHLIGFGIGPEKLVGICVERSIETVVGLLGILKAGGAYIPLDPSYPEERLRFMIKDAQVSVLLTQTTIVENRGWRIENGNRGEKDGRSTSQDGDPQSSILNFRVRAVYVDSDWPLIAQQKEDNPRSPVHSQNLAYVVYTSGSTGKPKGVQIDHRSVINCLHSLGERLEFTDRDVLLALTTISFDISVLELFLPLVTAGKVVVASRDQPVDGRALARLLANSRATALQATPSTWRLMIEAGWDGSPGFKILCGGEAMPQDLAQKLLTRGKVFNLYGPTESTIWSTLHKVESAEGPVRIGRSIENTKTYILDSYLQPVPIGVHGDLYIGGNGLARGYWNSPETTAECFIPESFSGEEGTRLYRTGDRACYRPDGTIEFLGRTDNQVKIRGHRVELPEIEAILSQHPGIKKCAVLAVNGRPSDDHPNSRTQTGLFAYYIASSEKPVEAELRSFLKQRLPDHMIPSEFVPMETLPLTHNGKLDHHALVTVAYTQPENPGLIEARTEVEELVVQTWREVLNINDLSVHDNFFEVGGHSLLGTQTVARLSEAFDREIPVSALFNAPTIRGLSAEIEKLLPGGPTPTLPSIVPAPRDGLLPLSMNQEHLWRLEQMVPGTSFFNMPYVYQLSGVLNIPDLEHALRDVIRRHEALRTVFTETDGRPIQIVKEPFDFQLPCIDLRGESADEISGQAASFILQERQTPFQLESGPLLRAMLLRLTDAEYLLLITLHHIIGDDWSMQVLVDELMTLYDCFSRKQVPSLPGTSIQLADYAFWERRLLDHGWLDAHQSYWEEQLAEPLPPLILRHNKNRLGADRLTFRRWREPIQFDENLMTRVRQFCCENGYTPFMVLVAALAVLIHGMTGESDVRLGTFIANRRRETDRVIGHLANTVVLRIPVSPEQTLRELLHEVRDTVLGALAYQELPFEYLVQLLESGHRSKRASIFNLLLLYQQRPLRPRQFGGLTFASLNVTHNIQGLELSLTTYPLILRLSETPTMLTGTVNYNADSFDASDVVKLKTSLNLFLRTMTSEYTNGVNDVRINSLTP